MTINLLNAAAPLTAANPMSSYIMLIVMLAAMYFLMFMPQKKQQKRDAQMRSSLDIGDEIVTQGGIIGRVVSMKDDTIIVETGSDRVKIRFLRNAVLRNNSQKVVAPVKKEKKSKKEKTEIEEK